MGTTLNAIEEEILHIERVIAQLIAGIREKVQGLQHGAKKFLRFLISRPPPTHYPRAANAQPISPGGTCVTELSKVFIALPCN